MIGPFHKILGRGLCGQHRYRTILFVHLGNLRAVSATLDDIVIELIPQCQRSQFGAWEFGYWAPIKTIEGESNEIKKESNETLNPNGKRRELHFTKPAF